MKVLMLGWELPPYNSGGLGVVSYELSKSLAESGADINFIVPYDAEHNIDFMQIHPALKLDPHSFRAGAGVYASVESARLGMAVSNFDGLLHQTQTYADAVRDRISCFSFDVIHVHDWLTLRAGVLAKQVSGKPLVVHIHATQFDQAGGKRGNEAVHEIEFMGLSIADRIVAVSQHTKNVIVKNYGIDPSKIEVVHNMIDPERWHLLDDHNPYPSLQHLKNAGYKVLVYLGRITVQKGLWNLLQAHRIVVQHNPKTILFLAGSGEQIRELQLLAAQLGIARNVVFSNRFVNGAEQRWVYRLGDLFVMPSVSEPFGLTALEAPLMGTAALISKQSGVAEVLKNSLKVDFWDIDGMANQITSALRSPALLETLVAGSQLEVRSMGWPKAAQRIHNTYRQVVA